MKEEKEKGEAGCAFLKWFPVMARRSLPWVCSGTRCSSYTSNYHTEKSGGEGGGGSKRGRPAGNNGNVSPLGCEGVPRLGCVGRRLSRAGPPSPPPVPLFLFGFFLFRNASTLSVIRREAHARAAGSPLPLGIGGKACFCFLSETMTLEGRHRGL